MDFLVAGFGFGALLVLAGYAVREFGVFLFAPARVRKTFADDADLAGAWRRLCRFGSNVAMIAGIVTWLVLIVAVALSVSDKTGSLVLACTATVVSLVGAGAVYLASRHLHDPVVVKHADMSAASAGWHEADSTESVEPVDGWKPRLLPKPNAVIVDDIPTWGAVYDHPTIEEAHLEPTPVEKKPQPEPAVAVETTDQPVEAVVADAEPVSQSAPEPIELELVETDVREPTAITTDANDPDETQADGAVAEVVANTEPIVTEQPVGPPADANGVDIESEPQVAKAEPEPAAVDEVISEVPAPEPEVGPTVLRRFKSALLSDLEDPSSSDANAKFKSSILADLSSVRLPDDGPRYRSTTLLDLAKPDEADVEPGSSDHDPNHRD